MRDVAVTEGDKVDAQIQLGYDVLGFGLGFSLPLFVLSLLSGSLQHQLTTLFARHSRVINIFGGLLLIGVAIYDLSKNWDMLQLFYS